MTFWPTSSALDLNTEKKNSPVNPDFFKATISGPFFSGLKLCHTQKTNFSIQILHRNFVSGEIIKGFHHSTTIY
jgi:hypothetical protein